MVLDQGNIFKVHGKIVENKKLGKLHPTIWGQKAKINDFSPYKKKTDS